MLVKPVPSVRLGVRKRGYFALSAKKGVAVKSLFG
jgi:hypothetical protein